MNAQAAFDVLALEMTIFATLLGFISIMFIFWYGHTKDRYTTKRAITLGEKIRKIFFHLSFYLFGIFIMFGFGGIFLGVWILSIFAAMTEPLSEIVLKSGVVNPLLLFTTWFSLWVFFTMLYIVLILLPTIWPKIEIFKKRGENRMKENVSKREYRDLKYLLIGIVVSAGLSLPSSFFIGWYFSVGGETNLGIVVATIILFWIVFLYVIYKISVLHKKSQ